MPKLFETKAKVRRASALKRSARKRYKRYESEVRSHQPIFSQMIKRVGSASSERESRNPTQLPCGYDEIKSWPAVGSSRVADQECNGGDWRRRVEWSGNFFEIWFPAGRAGSLRER